MKIESNEHLAEIIADHLLITEEDSLLFVNGVLNGYLFNGKMNVLMALSSRDRLIEELHEEVATLKEKLDIARGSNIISKETHDQT